MRNKRAIFPFVLLILSMGFFSCSPTKHVPEGDYLLKKFKIKTENKNIEKSEIKKYIRQKPNQRFLGLSFPLFLYNLSNPEKEQGIHKWLREKGEEPVVWDPFMMEESRQQIKNYLDKRGYYNAHVTDTVFYNNKKVTVKYLLEVNKPYRIKRVDYMVKDSVLKPFLYPDTSRLSVKQG
ncbi:MAG TPA: POTRA domain-containing protein, partial [Bacteroidales bacterium]|nr:POTRA domain-containing protein [Bacteroidales bacterium]